ncbi:MAG: glycosyltransferase family 39 protein [Candidatus Villigracilaceae bacterium]
MTSLPHSRSHQKFWLTFLTFIGVVGGTFLRLALMRLAKTPGHADSAFYYTVARNIVAGRGLVLDYVFNYLDGLPPIPHYSNDFWHPLASYLLAIPMKLLGVSVFNATLSSLAAGILIAVTAFYAGRAFGRTTEFGLLTALLTYFAPTQISISTTTDANVFFGLFGVLALYFTMRGLNRPKFFTAAAIFTGLSHLTRQDGLLLLMVLLGCILIARLPLKQRIGLAAAAVLIHVVVLSPLLLKNYSVFGQPFPSGPSRTMYMTEYEDFYAYGKTFTLKSYYGELGLKGIYKDKLDAAHDNLDLILLFLDRFVALALVIALLDLLLVRREWEKLRQLSPALLYSLIVYFFYALIASYSRGSTVKSLGSLLPFFYIIILDFVFTRLKKRWIIYPLLFAACIYLGQSGYARMVNSHTHYNQVYAELHQIQQVILADAASHHLPAEQIAVMSRNPWEFYEATGLTAVMIPNNSLATILQVANHYQVQYMILPAPRSDLHKIYNEKIQDPRLQLIKTFDKAVDIKIFRLNPEMSAP